MAEKKQLDGGQKIGPEKLIIRSEKARLIDLLSLLLLRRPITSYHFVEAGNQTAAELGSTPGDWVVAVTVAIQKVLAAIYWPARWLGIAVEFLLNFVSLNSGILGIVWNIFRCKLVIPLNREAANFRSIIGMIDGRTELKPMPSSTDSWDEHQRPHVVGISSWKASEDSIIDVESGECYSDKQVPLIKEQYYDLHEVTVMAAKLAYENEAYVKNVVNIIWKFNFVGFYSCWNKFMGKDGAYTTQAFVMTDRSSDASTVVVSFRGTELFNMQDWSTDVNLSWLRLGAMGNVHVGFLKALGLQEEDEKDAGRAFPRAAPKSTAGKPVAYYALRDVLRAQLKKHPNAQIVVTGHSLGGALATIFPALMAFHGETDVLGRLRAVHTYGQPRVGDKAFAAFCETRVPATDPVPLRAVYRYDVVPRVPFDAPPVARFTHGGECVYFDGWYVGHVVPAGGDVPDRNYFDPRFLASKCGNALGDLVKGAFLWTREGHDYREGAISLLYRTFGLVFPGAASHSPRDYVNAVRLGSAVLGSMEAGD